MSVRPLTYGNYNRKSSEDKKRQVLSIDSQREWAVGVVSDRRIVIAEIYKEEKSAEAPYLRPEFDKMVRDIRAGIINALIAWKLDRLARNPEEAGIIIGMLKRGEIRHIITSDREYRPEDNAIISYVDFGMADQYSRDLSKNVKRGLKAKLQMGWYPSRAPLGYLNSKRSEEKGRNWIENDTKRFESVKRMWQMMLTGNYTPPQILDIVNNEWKFRTREGKPLSRSMIYKMFNNPFYYSFFEYPKGSGEWFAGKHEPMITRQEFEHVQELLGNISRPRPLSRRFAFTGIMRCGKCGASITAEEKIKRHKNGNVHHYVYYHCTRRIDPKCAEGAIELKTLTGQIDTVLRRITISDRFRDWAIKYLHEIRTNEAQSHEQVIDNKQKRVLEITKQLDNLLLRYTSLANAENALLNDDEFKTIKSSLLKEKNTLETDLQAQSKAVEQWLELSARTFNFARYASIWFAKGDLETRRAIFACIGSDFIVKGRKLNVQLKKPFKFVFDGAEAVEKELLQVRTPENDGMKGQMVSIDPNCLILRRRGDSNSRCLAACRLSKAVH